MIGIWSHFFSRPVSFSLAACITAEGFVSAFMYAYVFDIMHQVRGVAEDTINKPHRPIPAGLLSLEGAQLRCLLSWIFFPLGTCLIYGPRAMSCLVFWQLWVYFCYVWPCFNHWIMRQLFSTVGQICMYRWVDEIVTHHASTPHIPISYDFFLALWSFLTIHVQEFHDMEGDRKTDRRTLPLVIAQTSLPLLRRITAFLLVASSTIIVGVNFDNHYQTWSKWGFVLAILHVGTSCIVGITCIRGGSSKMDEKTYKVYYMMAAIFLSFYLAPVFRTD